MMPQKQIEVEYDKEFDMLYLLVGPPTAAEAESLMKDVYIRRDAFNDRIAGVIIERYSKKDEKCLSQILPMGLGRYLPHVAH